MCTPAKLCNHVRKAWDANPHASDIQELYELAASAVASNPEDAHIPPRELEHFLFDHTLLEAQRRDTTACA